MSGERNERNVLFDIWKKMQRKQKMDGFEKLVSKVIAMHPQSHGLLSQPEVFADREFSHKEMDVFAHLGLHAVVMEMINSDSPSGFRSIYDQRVNQTKDRHRAQHDLMEALFGWWIAHSENEAEAPDTDEFMAELRDRFNERGT